MDIPKELRPLKQVQIVEQPRVQPQNWMIFPSYEAIENLPLVERQKSMHKIIVMDTDREGKQVYARLGISTERSGEGVDLTELGEHGLDEVYIVSADGSIQHLVHIKAQSDQQQFDEQRQWMIDIAGELFPIIMPNPALGVGQAYHVNAVGIEPTPQSKPYIQPITQIVVLTDEKIIPDLKDMKGPELSYVATAFNHNSPGYKRHDQNRNTHPIVIRNVQELSGIAPSPVRQPEQEARDEISHILTSIVYPAVQENTEYLPLIEELTNDLKQIRNTYLEEHNRSYEGTGIHPDRLDTRMILEAYAQAMIHFTKYELGKNTLKRRRNDLLDLAIKGELRGLKITEHLVGSTEWERQFQRRQMINIYKNNPETARALVNKKIRAIKVITSGSLTQLVEFGLLPPEELARLGKPVFTDEYPQRPYENTIGLEYWDEGISFLRNNLQHNPLTVEYVEQNIQAFEQYLQQNKDQRNPKLEQRLQSHLDRQKLLLNFLQLSHPNRPEQSLIEKNFPVVCTIIADAFMEDSTREVNGQAGWELYLEKIDRDDMPIIFVPQENIKETETYLLHFPVNIQVFPIEALI